MEGMESLKIHIGSCLGTSQSVGTEKLGPSIKVSTYKAGYYAHPFVPEAFCLWEIWAPVRREADERHKMTPCYPHQDSRADHAPGSKVHMVSAPVHLHS